VGLPVFQGWPEWNAGIMEGSGNKVIYSVFLAIYGKILGKE
jgi:hypothetical protein